MVRFHSSRHQRGGWRGGVRFTPARADPGPSTAADNVNLPASEARPQPKADSKPKAAPHVHCPTCGRVKHGPSVNCMPDPADVKLPVDLFWNIREEPDGTYRIAYKGICGLNHPGVNGGEGVYFEFPERVPCGLCFRTFGMPVPLNCDEIGKYVAAVVSRHNQRIMETRDWECQFCGQVAHEMCHAPIPFFNPAIGDGPNFRPTIWDFVVPICRSLSECDEKAEKLTIELVMERFHGTVLVSESSCQACGAVNGLMTCGGCNRVKYCSKKCQAGDWTKHKKNCRFAQKEVAKEAASKEKVKVERPKKKKSKKKKKCGMEAN